VQSNAGRHPPVDAGERIYGATTPQPADYSRRAARGAELLLELSRDTDRLDDRGAISADTRPLSTLLLRVIGDLLRGDLLRRGLCAHRRRPSAPVCLAPEFMIVRRFRAVPEFGSQRGSDVGHDRESVCGLTDRSSFDRIAQVMEQAGEALVDVGEVRAAAVLVRTFRGRGRGVQEFVEIGFADPDASRSHADGAELATIDPVCVRSVG
jgi:hypothetical protein